MGNASNNKKTKDFVMGSIKHRVFHSVVLYPASNN